MSGQDLGFRAGEDLLDLFYHPGVVQGKILRGGLPLQKRAEKDHLLHQLLHILLISLGIKLYLLIPFFDLGIEPLFGGIRVAIPGRPGISHHLLRGLHHQYFGIRGVVISCLLHLIYYLKLPFFIYLPELLSSIPEDAVAVQQIPGFGHEIIAQPFGLSDPVYPDI